MGPRSIARSFRERTGVRDGEAAHLTVLQTADIHGQLDTHDEFFWEDGGPRFRRAGGMARIQTLVDQVRAENPEGTILLDGGDCFQGSGWVTLSRGEVMPPVMRQLGYDAVIPGNWEVVYGKQQLLSLMQA
jgi:S-sulfosulfanyl-L-cysteine sulfohydrolase